LDSRLGRPPVELALRVCVGHVVRALEFEPSFFGVCVLFGAAVVI
jgi:hypothetical protein